MSVIQISAMELQEKLQGDDKPLLLDVRESNEFEFARIEGSLHIPLNQVSERMSEIKPDVDCIVICHHGMRSQQAANFLVHSGLGSIYNLSGGIDAWSVACDNTVSRY
ncbi:MAG: rhodanese [Methylomarinum sp.]|nr:rhodanese [Methylomarinum sp.]